MEEMQTPAAKEQELTPQESLLQALLLGAGAGLVGATIGWSIMSSHHSFAAAAELPSPPVILSEETSVVARKQIPAPDSPQRLAYYLQVGAYHDRNSAEALAARLESEGFKVAIRRKGTFHRLIVGPEHSPAGIDEVTRRLAETVDLGNLDRPSAWITLGPVQGSEL